MPSKIREIAVPEKPIRGAWLRRFTYLVETSLRSEKDLRPSAAGKKAAEQLRGEWATRFPDVSMPKDWIAS